MRDPGRPEEHVAGTLRHGAGAHDERGPRRGARPPADRERGPLADREALRTKARALAKTTPVQPLALLGAIGDMLPKDAVVIEEALSSAPGIRQLIRSDDPQSYFGLRGGGIGWACRPRSDQLALPHRPVVALIGDGSALYTVQALWTAAHYRIPVVRDPQQHVLSHPQAAPPLPARARRAGRHLCGMELVNPAIDFVGLSRSLGVAAERAKTVHDATDLIGKALNDNVPMLIDVELDRAFKPM